MLNGKLTPVAPALADERGFTLIELLVSMLAAFVVTGALFAILEVSLQQTSLITDKVQANQLGRTAMTKLVDELHSACIAPGFKPIQPKSSGSEIVFKNAYSSEAVILNAKEAEPKAAGTGVFEHQIVWNSSAKTLTDFTYKSESGEGTEATFPAVDYSSTTKEAQNASPKKGVLLASDVTQTEESGKPVAIFKYFKYNTEYSSTATSGLSTLKLLSLSSSELTEAEDNEAAAVVVSFRQAPVDNNSQRDRFVDLKDQVTFAFSVPNAETPVEDTPCE
jgi:prepilin-type N-terminal cleavage/methylation domain-containing protein